MSTTGVAPVTDRPDRRRSVPRRRRRLSGLQIAGLALLVLLFVSVLRVVTGRTTSPPPVPWLPPSASPSRSAWPVSVASGRSGPASSTSASRA